MYKKNMKVSLEMLKEDAEYKKKHIESKDRAQQEKIKDKDIMNHDSKIHVVTFDLQSVLMLSRFDLQSVLMLSRLTYKVYSCCHV